MTERFLNYVWFKRLFYEEQRCVDGERVEVIDLGQPNTDAGADVFNAKVRIGDTLWAGNVEFHRRASDWLLHRHEQDKAYDSVILHVVLESDCRITRHDGTLVPQLVLQYPKRLEQEYLEQVPEFVHCMGEDLEPLLTNKKELFEHLISERLEQRKEAIERELERSSGDWEEAFYRATARSFGFGTNADAFENLAKNLPQKVIAKHRDSLLQVEAMMFGMAGFLDGEPQDDYHGSLQQEFQYLRHKFSLKPCDRSLWKFLRLRPMNFPTVRLAQFSDLVFRSSKLFSKILEQKSHRELLKYYQSEPSEYWLEHYQFGKPSKERSKKLSKKSIDIILINSVVPFLYAYGSLMNLPELQRRAERLLEEIPAEQNFITRGFAEIGLIASSAKESQALKRLKSAYCEPKKCYLCKNKFWTKIG